MYRYYRELVFHFTGFGNIIILLILVFFWGSNVDRPTIYMLHTLLPSVIVGPLLISKYFIFKNKMPPVFSGSEWLCIYAVVSALVFTFGLIGANILASLFDIYQSDYRSKGLLGGGSVLSLLAWVFYPHKGWEKLLIKEISSFNESLSSSTPKEINDKLRNLDRPKEKTDHESTRKDGKSCTEGTRTEKKSHIMSNIYQPSKDNSRDYFRDGRNDDFSVPSPLYKEIICDLEFPDNYLLLSSRETITLLDKKSYSYIQTVLKELVSYKNLFCQNSGQERLKMCNKVFIPFYLIVASEACRQFGVSSRNAPPVVLKYFQHQCELILRVGNHEFKDSTLSSLRDITESLLSVAPPITENEMTIIALGHHMNEVVRQIIRTEESR